MAFVAGPKPAMITPSSTRPTLKTSGSQPSVWSSFRRRSPPHPSHSKAGETQHPRQEQDQANPTTPSATRPTIKTTRSQPSLWSSFRRSPPQQEQEQQDATPYGLGRRGRLFPFAKASSQNSIVSSRVMKRTKSSPYVVSSHSRRLLISGPSFKKWKKRLGFHKKSHQEGEGLPKPNQQQPQQKLHENHHPQRVRSDATKRISPPRLEDCIELLQSDLNLDNKCGLDQIMTILKTVSILEAHGPQASAGDVGKNHSHHDQLPPSVGLALANALVYDDHDKAMTIDKKQARGVPACVKQHVSFFDKADEERDAVAKKRVTLDEYRCVRHLLATFLCNSIAVADVTVRNSRVGKSSSNSRRNNNHLKHYTGNGAVSSSRKPSALASEQTEGDGGMTTDDETVSQTTSPEHDDQVDADHFNESDHNNNKSRSSNSINNNGGVRNDRDCDDEDVPSVAGCKEEAEDYYYDSDDTVCARGRHDGLFHSKVLEILVQALQLVGATSSTPTSTTNSLLDVAYHTNKNHTVKNRLINFGKNLRTNNTNNISMSKNHSLSFWNSIVTESLVRNIEHIQEAEDDGALLIGTRSIQCLLLLRSLEPCTRTIDFLVQTVLFPYLIHAEEVGQALQHAPMECLARQLLQQTTISNGDNASPPSCPVSQARVYL